MIRKIENKIIYLILLYISFYFLTVQVYATEINIENPTIETIEESIIEETEKSLSEENSMNEIVEELYGHAENIGDITELNYKLVYNENNRKIFYDQDLLVYVDINGLVENEELLQLGIIDSIEKNQHTYIEYEDIEDNEPEFLPEPKEIALNITTIFDNIEIEDTSIYNIILNIQGETYYKEGEDATHQFGEIVLSRTENFQKYDTFLCDGIQFEIYPKIPTDMTGAYNVEIEYAGEKTNVFSSTMDTYDIIVHISKPNYTNDDVNYAPSLSNDFDEFKNGKYAESRRFELELEESESETPTGNEEPVIKNSDYSIFIIIGIILIIMLGIGGVVYIKRLQRDDE